MQFLSISQRGVTAANMALWSFRAIYFSRDGKQLGHISMRQSATLDTGKLWFYLMAPQFDPPFALPQLHTFQTVVGVESELNVEILC